MKRPLGENLTKETGGLSSSISVLRHWPVAVSQMRHSPSYEPETISVPSHEKCTPDTGSECAGRILRHFDVLTHQMRSDSSKEPEASMLPCGEKATQKTKLAWPRIVLSILPSDTFHSRMVRSSDAEAT